MALAATAAAAAQAAAFAVATPAGSAQAERTVTECSRFCQTGCGRGVGFSTRRMMGAHSGCALLSRNAKNDMPLRRASRVRAAASGSQDVAVKQGESSDAVSGTQEPKKYYFVVANSQFMLGDEEHFQEQLKERLRFFGEQGREQDFWLVHEPAFLDTMPEIGKRVKRPCTALVSTDGTWMTFMKLRLDRVMKGEYTAPSADIPEPLASKAAIGDFEVIEPEKWVAPYPKYTGEWWKPFLPA